MSLDFGKLNFSTSFNPTSAFPLDSRSYFESYDAAVAAAATADIAGSSTTKYYFGETIAVVENDIATLYTIQPDGTLAEVGGKVEINENVFVHDEDGSLNLLGFAEAVVGAQLIKSADGKLSWVLPDSSTVEGLELLVDGLRKDVDSLTGVVGAPADAEAATEATGLFAELEKKANVSDVYTITQTDSAISTAIANADHMKRVEVASVDEIDVGAADADKFIYMVAKTGEDGDHFDEYMVMNGAVEKVGNWGVSLVDYVKRTEMEEALLGKVDVVEGSRLMTEEEGTRLAGIADGAQVNVIDTVDETQFAIDGAKNLTLLDIAMSKVTGLTDALAAKVDAVEGSRLMTEEEGTRLAGIADGAQVNVIDAVSSEFTISADGKELSVVEIDQSKITGLSDALAANANVIEVVKFNGTALPITDKAVDITLPVATDTLLGAVKSSTLENKVSVDAAGEMEVNSVNVNKLVQTEGDVLILNGGTSAK